MKKGTAIALSLLGGLVAGFVLGYLVCFAVFRAEERELKEGWALVPVVVANQDLAAGTPIDYDLVAKMQCPEQFVSASTIKPSEFEKVIGRKLQVPMLRGDVFLWPLFAERPASADKPAQPPPASGP
ncbi:MAG: hypothetical protein JXR96_08855 [Deltaproteobacteria bacterium]|nr:hypothetical protein [Deltaproteobacteria bacterium]